MKQKHYTLREKSQHISELHRLKDKDQSYSIRRYACEHKIRYYTLRDWWRSEETNDRWRERYPGSHEQNSSRCNDLPFVMIEGGN